MAESICGPSNALQTFQKHSSVDRTLQQDRLVSQQSASQGFRSSPGRIAGLADPEFEAFQAGHLPVDPSFQLSNFSHAHPLSQSFQQAGPSAWASDFQRMHISSPTFRTQQQPFVPQAQLRHDTGGWHQDFARQHSQTKDQATGQITGQVSSSLQNSGGISMGNRFVGGLVMPMSDTSSLQQKQPAEIFDDEAFTRAFDAAAQAEEMDISQDTNQEQTSNIAPDVMLDDTAERFMSENTDQGLILDQERIGADKIHDQNSINHRDEQQDPDALSRTAGQLLKSVEHNQSSKFQNSQFLTLMRRFRDKQALVQDDQVVRAGKVDGDTDTKMVEQSSAQDALKKSLSANLHAIKKMLLDRDRPYKSTLENQSKLVHLLTQVQDASSNPLCTEEMVEELRMEAVITRAISACMFYCQDIEIYGRIMAIQGTISKIRQSAARKRRTNEEFAPSYYPDETVVEDDISQTFNLPPSPLSK